MGGSDDDVDGPWPMSTTDAMTIDQKIYPASLSSLLMIVDA